MGGGQRQEKTVNIGIFLKKTGRRSPSGPLRSDNLDTPGRLPTLIDREQGWPARAGFSQPNGTRPRREEGGPDPAVQCPSEMP